MTAISARNLSKCYMLYEQPRDRLLQFLFRGRRAFGRALWALNEVSFEVRRGEVLGIVGRNGAGKSTLLQLVCGTLQATAGEIEVNGRVAALLELGAGFNPEFTGRENVFLNAAILGVPEDETRERFASIVEFSGIGDFIDQPVKTYSSGMYVRLAFSVATAIEPDILVIDEALSVGDGGFARKSFDRIMALKERGATILFCSHAMYHVEALCERALWIEQGRVAMLDAAQRVTRAYGSSLLQENEAPPVPALATGKARLTRVAVSVDGKEGRRFILRPGRSTVRVVACFAADPALPRPTVAFGIETLAGVGVTSGSTLFDGARVDMDERGFGEVRLDFPGLPLMRGEYRLTIFLACERSLLVYDQAPYCVEFEVQDEGPAQGVAFLPHAWNGAAILTAPPGQARE